MGRGYDVLALVGKQGGVQRRRVCSSATSADVRGVGDRHQDLRRPNGTAVTGRQRSPPSAASARRPALLSPRTATCARRRACAQTCCRTAPSAVSPCPGGARPRNATVAAGTHPASRCAAHRSWQPPRRGVRVVEPAVPGAPVRPAPAAPATARPDQLLGKPRQCGHVAQQLHAPPVAGVDIHRHSRPPPAPPGRPWRGHRCRARGPAQAVVRAQRVLEGGDARLDIRRTRPRVATHRLNQLVIAKTSRSPRPWPPPARPPSPRRSGAANNAAPRCQCVHARAEHGSTGGAPTSLRGATSNGSVSSVHPSRPPRTAHTSFHSTRGVLRTSLVELL